VENNGDGNYLGISMDIIHSRMNALACKVFFISMVSENFSKEGSLQQK
jgi:hypothetical protein